MTEQELKEIFELLEAQGLRPKLYDTPVPFYDEHVPCGSSSFQPYGIELLLQCKKFSSHLRYSLPIKRNTLGRNPSLIGLLPRGMCTIAKGQNRGRI